jgi:hypothetical protein
VRRKGTSASGRGGVLPRRQARQRGRVGAAALGLPRQRGCCIGADAALERPLRLSGHCVGAATASERPLRRSGRCVGAAAVSERPLRRSGRCVGAAAASELPLLWSGGCIGGATALSRVFQVHLCAVNHCTETIPPQ